MPRRRARPEELIHRAVLDHIRWRGVPFLFTFHTPNGGQRSPIEAKILKGLGVVAGIPDLLILHRGQLFGLELKAESGRVSKTQAECHSRLRASGARIATAVGVDEALRQLEAWSLLRPDASNRTANLHELRDGQSPRRAARISPPNQSTPGDIEHE
jgi:hypothetical protein